MAETLSDKEYIYGLNRERIDQMGDLQRLRRSLVRRTMVYIEQHTDGAPRQMPANIKNDLDAFVCDVHAWCLDNEHTLWTDWYSQKDRTELHCRLNNVMFPLWTKDLECLALDVEDSLRGMKKDGTTDCKSYPDYPYVMAMSGMTLHLEGGVEIMLDEDIARRFAKMLRERFEESRQT